MKERMAQMSKASSKRREERRMLAPRLALRPRKSVALIVAMAWSTKVGCERMDGARWGQGGKGFVSEAAIHGTEGDGMF